MSLPSYIVELSSDDESVANDAEFTVVEIDDDLGESGATIEELEVDYLPEDMDANETIEINAMEPVVEEPDEVENAPLVENIELSYNSTPLVSQPLITKQTSLRDLFELARYHIDLPQNNEELWFQIEPLGLEVGEDNSFTFEPTMGDLMQLLESPSFSSRTRKGSPCLKINVEGRESFYHKFRDMLSNLSLQDSNSDHFIGNKRRRK